MPSSENPRFILWLEGKRVRVPNLVSAVQDAGYTVVAVANGREALQAVAEHPPALTVIYAASIGSSGARLVRRLHEAAPDAPLVLIVDRHLQPLPQVPYGKVLRLPLSPKRLLRVVRKFLPPPDEAPQWQEYGPIRFDPVHHRVRCEGRERTLTPKTAQLLTYFLQHPNRLISRDELFEAVWNMPSNNDLRTLEVHICWLRKALERNPRRPRFLKTVRGRGYIFELPTTEKADSSDAETPSS